MSKVALVAALIAAGGTAMAQIHLQALDVLDGAEAGAPTPAGVVVIDGFVDLNNIPGIAWAAAGIRCVTSNGATLRYQMIDADGDLNTPLVANLINTGSVNDRFVTSISRPRGRDAADRFDNGGATSGGDYDPAGPNPPTTTPTELNAAYFSNPYPVPADLGVDGYVLRIALDAPGFSAENVLIGGPTPPAGYGILLASIVGFDDGTPAPGFLSLTYSPVNPFGISAYLWGVPEPSSLALLAFGTLAIRRRSRTGG